MIELLTLKLENFLSHHDTFIDLSSYLDLVLIEGRNSDGRYESNGSGKSSILEGLIYVLSGNTLRGVGVNDVVNRQVGKDTKVTLCMKVDGISYTVERHRAHTTYGDSLVLIREGTDISKRLNRDTQVLLDDIIGVSYNILISVLFLGEGLSAKFTQLSDPDKKSIIESSLNLPYDFNKIRDNVNKELKSFKSSIDSAQGKHSGIQQVIQGVTPDSVYTDECIKELADNLDTLSAEYSRLYDEYGELREKLDVLVYTIGDYEKDSKLLKNLEDQIFELGNQILTIEEGEDPICPQCKQVLVNNEAKQNAISSLNVRIDDLDLKMVPLMESIAKIPDIEVAKGMKDTLKRQSDEVANRLSTMYGDIQKLTQEKMAADSINELHSKLSGYKEELNVLESRITEFTQKVDDLSYLYTLFGPTGLIVYILEESVKYINHRLKLYSEILLDKSYEVVFKKGKISLLDAGGSTYQSLSNGEKRRLDIAIQFSLHDYVTTYCGKGIDTIFIDEVLDTLDSVGVRNIIEVLRMKIEYCNAKRIFLITHNNDLKSQVDSFITVVKDSEGISTILEEVN